jgi:hypothetical protein
VAGLSLLSRWKFPRHRSPELGAIRSPVNDSRTSKGRLVESHQASSASDGSVVGPSTLVATSMSAAVSKSIRRSSPSIGCHPKRNCPVQLASKLQ